MLFVFIWLILDRQAVERVAQRGAVSSESEKPSKGASLDSDYQPGDEVIRSCWRTLITL